MSWLLVVPQHGTQEPYLVDTHDDGAMEKLVRDQQVRADIEPRGEAELYDVSPGAVTPARIKQRTMYEVEVADVTQLVGDGAVLRKDFSYPGVDEGTTLLPAPGVLPQRRPRREEVLDQGSSRMGAPLNGSDEPPQYDEVTGDRVVTSGPIGVGDWQAPATTRGFGPFKRRED